MTIRFEYASLPGVRLYYAAAGSGEKLVILLHGFPECWYSWRHQLDALGDQYFVVAPDLRGYNLSDKPAGLGEYRIDRLTSDVAQLIRHFGQDKAVIVGHDWGAAIAWSLAMNHPELVSKLIVLQVPPMHVWKRNLSFAQLAASWYMLFFQLPWLPEWFARSNDYALLEGALCSTTAARGVFTQEDVGVYKNGWRQPGALTAMINYYRANFPGRSGSANKTIEKKVGAPTLFIYGEKDHAILPQTVKGVGDSVAGPYREHRIPTSAHWVQQEAPDEVTRVIREFLAD
ncbi:MAG: alpha/beta fold hydrolase [Pyrinomonadaceae bacterium]